MTTVSSRTFLENPAHYFNLANHEGIAIKRGKMIYKIVAQPEFENPSPSGDPYFAIPENITELNRRIRERNEGKTKFTVLTPERQKELLGL